MARVLFNPRGIPFGEDNIFLHGKARAHFSQSVRAPLSVKAVLRGEGRWKTSEGEFIVDSSNLLIVNQDQDYSLTIDAREPVETFCFFLKSGLAAQIGEFRERVWPGQNELTRRLRAIHAAGLHPEPLWLDSQVFAIANEMRSLLEGERLKCDSIRASKPATREELFRRVQLGKAWLDAHFDENDAGIEGAARNSFLSPFHFHRVFTRVFGVTPHRYVVERRLGRAAHLLSTTRLPVVDVCAEVGFQSLGSFSTLFRARFGITPARARN